MVNKGLTAADRTPYILRNHSGTVNIEKNACQDRSNAMRSSLRIFPKNWLPFEANSETNKQSNNNDDIEEIRYFFLIFDNKILSQ